MNEKKIAFEFISIIVFLKILGYKRKEKVNQLNTQFSFRKFINFR